MLKVKEMSGHITQGPKNVEPFLVSADHPCFKRQSRVKKKNVKFPGKESSTDQETTKKKNLNTC